MFRFAFTTWPFATTVDTSCKFELTYKPSTHTETSQFSLIFSNENDPSSHGPVPPNTSEIDTVTVQRTQTDSVVEKQTFVYGEYAYIRYEGSFQGMYQVAVTNNNGDTWYNMESTTESPTLTDEWEFPWKTHVVGDGCKVRFTLADGTHVVSNEFSCVVSTFDLSYNDFIVGHPTSISVEGRFQRFSECELQYKDEDNWVNLEGEYYVDTVNHQIVWTPVSSSTELTIRVSIPEFDDDVVTSNITKVKVHDSIGTASSQFTIMGPYVTYDKDGITMKSGSSFAIDWLPTHTLGSVNALGSKVAVSWDSGDPQQVSRLERLQVPSGSSATLTVADDSFDVTFT